MPAGPDLYERYNNTPTAPARAGATVTPSDSVDLSIWAKALYVGQAGDVCVIPAGADALEAITLRNHPVGYAPVQVRRVLETGTTAGDIVALFD